MRKGIHPELHLMEVHQTDGSTFTIRSTSKAGKISLDVDSKSHPAFTGESRIIDTTGRVERFQKKFAWDQARMEEAKKSKKVEVGQLAQVSAAKQIKVPRIIEQKKPQFGKDGKPVAPKDGAAPAKDGKEAKGEKPADAKKAEKPVEAKVEAKAEAAPAGEKKE